MTMLSLVRLADVLSVKVFLVFGVVFLVTYWLLRQRDTRQLPPGPPWLPVVGSLPFMLYRLWHLKFLYKVFLFWREKYGDIFRMRMGSLNVIVINGYKYVSKVLREKGECINMRPNFYILQQLFKGEGALFSNGAKWHDMRKFAVVTMRDFGLGKKSLEERIQDEARITMETISDLKKPFYPREILLKTVCNIICGICFGQRFDFRDPKFAHVLSNVDVFFRTVGPQMPENFFPWIKYIPWICKVPMVCECNKVLISFITDQMKAHEETFDEDNIRDFMDLHLLMKRSGEHKETLTDSHTFRAMIDLFIAGTETTASSMSFLLAYMLRHPEVQSKCQAEIDQVVGSGRMVSLSDKPNLKFTVAVMQEVQRLSNIAVIGVPRACKKDFQLGGYVVPKDSVVILHLSTVLRDETYWEAAEEFQPERWIGEDGELKKFDAFFPFSLGPRACLGEPLAKMELFLFFTNFLQSFTFKLPVGASPPSLEGVQTGAVQLTEEYHLIAEKRV